MGMQRKVCCRRKCWRGLVQESTAGVPAELPPEVLQGCACWVGLTPDVPAEAATGSAGVACCRDLQQVCLPGLPPSVLQGWHIGSHQVRRHAARGVLPCWAVPAEAAIEKLGGGGAPQGSWQVRRNASG